MPTTHVVRVDAVTITAETANPPRITVSAKGMASTPGWTNARLIERTGPPSGSAAVRVLDFLADPPGDIRPQVLAPIAATSHLAGPFPPEMRVTVVSRTNAIDASHPVAR